MKQLVIAIIVGIVSWYDAQNGTGMIDGKYSVHFSMIVNEKKVLQANDSVQYEVVDERVIWVMKL